MARVVGIDLGTTNSVIATMIGGEVQVIPNAEGSRLTPSVAGFTKTGERLVGQMAKRQAVLNPENTVSSIKRFMGRRLSEVETERAMVPYKVEDGQNGMAVVRIPAAGKTFTPEEISAMILQKLKTDAAAYLGEKVTDALVNRAPSGPSGSVLGWPARPAGRTASTRARAARRCSGCARPPSGPRWSSPPSC